MLLKESYAISECPNEYALNNLSTKASSSYVNPFQAQVPFFVTPENVRKLKPENLKWVKDTQSQNE